MDAPVIAAIITATTTPILAGAAAWLGGRGTVRVARENRQWDNIHRAIDDLHGEGKSDALVEDAYNHLEDLLRLEKLNPAQRAWIKKSLRTYLNRKLRGSVG